MISKTLRNTCILISHWHPGFQYLLDELRFPVHPGLLIICRISREKFAENMADFVGILARDEFRQKANKEAKKKDSRKKNWIKGCQT